MHVKLVFIYTINIQVSKYRFSKNSFNLILNVANGSFFNSHCLNYSITQQLYIENLVENRGICSASLFLVARLFSSLRLRNRSHRYVGARLFIHL